MSRRSRPRPNPRTAVQRISGPPELLQAVPYLLGFHPRRSLVLVGLESWRLVVTARLDLDDAAFPGVVRDTVTAMAAGGASSVIAAVYDDDAAPLDSAMTGDELTWSDVIERAGCAADDCGVYLADAVAVRRGRWRSYGCDGMGCCPPAGYELPDTTPAFAAHATLSGRAPLADRADVEASMDPLPDPDAAQLSEALADAESAAVQTLLSGAAARQRRAEVRALFAAARASDEAGWDWLATDDAARFGAALSGIEVRDAVWMGVDAGRIDGRALWRYLGRRLPAPYSAAPLFLFGWASWRAGDGALAGIAAERAVRSDPTYTAADLLQSALSQGIDPRRLPKIRRSA